MRIIKLGAEREMEIVCTQCNSIIGYFVGDLRGCYKRDSENAFDFYNEYIVCPVCGKRIDIKSKIIGKGEICQ